MQDRVQIRRPTEDDVPAIMGLLQNSLGEAGAPKSEEFFRWKHQRNPFGSSPSLVAEADGDIVGLRIFMRWQWRGSNGTVPAVRAVDTATHPDWRRRGIFSQLTMELVEQSRASGIVFVFNTPNDKSRPGYLKMGWSEVGKIPILVRPVRPLRLAQGLLAGGRRAGTLLPLRGFSPLGDFLDTAEAERLLDALDVGDGCYTTPRSREYLEWRYLQIPEVRYSALWQERDGSAAAVVFHGKERRGLREACVTEVLVSDEDGVDCAAQLLRRLARQAPVDYLVASGLQGTLERAALRRAWFFPVKGLGPTLCVRPLAEEWPEPDPMVRASWRCSIGDLELF